MFIERTRQTAENAEQRTSAAFAGFARAIPFLILAVMAFVATAAYGKGNIVGEGINDLHIDPIHFLQSLWYTWEPRSVLGAHNGFTQVYLTPYSFLYGFFALFHIPAQLAQRFVVFCIYFWISAGMYAALKFIEPDLHPAARLAGAAAYLFNIYVAFNSAGSVPMLLTYAALPCIVAAIAAALDGRCSSVFAAAAIALVVFAGSGINPPLIIINVIIAVVFVASYFLWEGWHRAIAIRLAWTTLSATALTLALNLYWIVPFLQYIKTTWIGGVLDESPMMHNADSSFSNVLRGLGQWSIFASGPAGPYYPWAHAYQAGQLFAFLLWLVPILGVAALAFRSNRTRALPFFLLVAFISAPLAVGYYSGPLGPALTAPIYDFFYTHVPGFQMFRSAYKWVGAYEFAAAGLFAVFVSSALAWIRALRWHRNMVSVMAALTLLLPVVSYLPVIAFQANYPMSEIPPWVRSESAFVGSAPQTRVALFPSQYLEQFLWGSPGYYMEHSVIYKPLIFGYLGAAMNESSDEWLRLAYRRARQGDPQATAIFRTLSVSTILQRDDFRSDEDFAFPEVGVSSNATLAHDALARIMGLSQTRQDAANRSYAVPSPLHLVYGVRNPRFALTPAVGVATSIDPSASAQGEATISLDGMSLPQVREAMSAGTVAAALPAALDDYATTQLLPNTTHVEIQQGNRTVEIARDGKYRIAAIDLGPDHRYPLESVTLDNRKLHAIKDTSAWQVFGDVSLRKGTHVLAAKHAGFLAPVLVSFIDSRIWAARRADIESAVKKPLNQAMTVPIKQPTAQVRIDAANRYRISATPLRVLMPLERNSRPIILDSGRSALTIAGGAAQTFELPYIPDGGVVPTATNPLSPSWYSRADTYTWNRGSAFHWWLLTRDSQFIVYAPRNMHATLRMRFASLVPIEQLTIRSEKNFTVRVSNQPPLASAGPISTVLPMTQSIEAPVALGSGRNVVHVSCVCGLQGMRPQDITDSLLQQNEPIIGAAGGDLSFTTDNKAARNYVIDAGYALKVKPMPGGALAIFDPHAPSARKGFQAAAFRLQDTSLDGDPYLSGAVNHISGAFARAWIGEIVASHRHVTYRVVPLEHPVGLNVSLAEMLPNTSTDASTRIVALLLFMSTNTVTQTSSVPPVFAVTDVALVRSATPQRSYPGVLKVDGRELGSTAFLTAGTHQIEYSNKALIDTLTIERPGTLQSKLIAMQTDYVTPVHIAVSVPKRTSPFVLVLNESFYPQWVARLGDRQLTHVQVNGFANGWLVPAGGSGTVNLEFTAQRGFIFSVIISVLALLTIVAILVLRPLESRAA